MPISKKEGKLELIIRFFQAPQQKSYFIFGPRGPGKSTWVKKAYPNAVIIDLLEPDIYRLYKAYPERLREVIEASSLLFRLLFLSC